MSEDKKSRWYVAGVIALYWFISISLVYINKFIVSAQPVPIFITWSQVRLCTVVYQVCGCQALDSTVAWMLLSRVAVDPAIRRGLRFVLVSYCTTAVIVCIPRLIAVVRLKIRVAPALPPLLYISDNQSTL